MGRIHQEASLSDDVYYHLKDYILYDVSYPSERLQLGQLSEHFGVSITPIREALIRLSAESIIDSKPGRGFFYREYLPSEQIALYETLVVLLEAAIARAGTRTSVRFLYDLKAMMPPVGDARAGDRTAVRATVTAVEKLIEQIAAISGNRELVLVVRNLCERTRSSRILDFEHPANAADLVEDIKLLVVALQRGESSRAITMLRDLLDKKRRRMQTLASERRRRIYETHPLLRPGAGRHMMVRYSDDDQGDKPNDA
jgi:DNA-binding GntR family transcriptional regulator